MTDVLLFLHLVGLMMGAGGGFGSMVTMRVAAKQPPDIAAAMRTPGPAFARFSAIGLALMWASGLALVWLQYGGFAGLSAMFWVKMLFVATLTIAATLTELTYAGIKRGDAAAAKRLPVLGPMAGLSSLLAVLFAVFAFH
jgi:hypothetical protein